MTDEPENHTLRVLREMREENAGFREEVRQGFREVHQEAADFRAEVNDRSSRLEAESRSQSETLGKVIDAVTKIATVQEQHSGHLARIERTQQSHGARLNIIDGRLAELEAHVGLVKA